MMAAGKACVSGAQHSEPGGHHLHLAGCPAWFIHAVEEAEKVNELLRSSGARQSVRARKALLSHFIRAAVEAYNEEVTVVEAALLTGKCEETIRRKVRRGELRAARSKQKGKIRIRRGDLSTIDG